MDNLITTLNLKELTFYRKLLHSKPELSGEEFETAQTVAKVLNQLTPAEVISELGGTGLLARFEHDQSGPSLLFRAELDALPIQEINSFKHKSQFDGLSHKCGHDGHMAILIGLASRLANDNKLKGRNYLLFQPAEETGEGAQYVLNDSRMQNFYCDYAFALHNLPKYPLGTVVLRKGAFSASVKSLIIKLKGKTSHAAEPENGHNPALAIAEIIQSLTKLNIPDVSKPDFALITPVSINMGEIAYGVSAGAGEIHLTLRTWTPDIMDNLSEAILKIVDQTANNHNLSWSNEWTNEFKANLNNEEAVNIIHQAAEQLNLNIVYRKHPLKWGEDFGAITQSFKGAMFGLGAGVNHPALHNPDYDFPDDLIDIGVNIFHSIARLVAQ